MEADHRQSEAGVEMDMEEEKKDAEELEATTLELEIDQGEVEEVKDLRFRNRVWIAVTPDTSRRCQYTRCSPKVFSDFLKIVVLEVCWSKLSISGYS